MGRSYNYCLYCCKEKGRPGGCEICGPEAAGKEPERHPNFLSPGILLKDQYLAGRVLGHGGFGVTYLGVDVNLDLRLAIKEHLPKDLATRHKDGQTVVPYTGQASDTFSYSLDKFLEEGRMLVRLGDPEHPNIVTAINFFKAHGTGYLLMRYLDGVSLEQYRINQGGRLPEQQAVQILMAVLDGLRAVHQAGMLHRDVKPENVILTRQGHVKLIDFGAARFAIGERTRTMTQIFTPGFAPFEQCHSGGKQGPWTDIYAAGATMYMMLTGQMPVESLARMSGDEDLQSPRQILGNEVSESVSIAVMQALAMNSSDRYESIEAFQEALVSGSKCKIPGQSLEKNGMLKRAVEAEKKAAIENEKLTAQGDRWSDSIRTRTFRLGLLSGLAVMIPLIVGFIIWRMSPTENPPATSDSYVPDPGKVTQSSQPSPSDSETMVLVAKISRAVAGEQWKTAVETCQQLSGEAKISASANCSMAKMEMSALELFEKMHSAALQKKHLELIRHHSKIPPNSIYKERDLHLVANAKAKFLEQAKKDLDDLISQGECQDAYTIVANIKEIDPTDTQARLKARRCIRDSMSKSQQLRPKPRLKPRPPKPQPKANSANQAQALLRGAENAYVAGNHQRAIQLAQKVLKLVPRHTRAIQVLGSSACYLKNQRLAQWALDRLKPAARALMKKLCKRNGLLFEQNKNENK